MPRTHIVLHALFPLSQAAFIGVQLYYALRTRDLPYTIVLVCCSPMCAGIDVLLVKHLIAADQRDKEHDRLRLLELQAEAQRRRMQDFDDASTHLRDEYHDFLNKLDDLDRTLRAGAAHGQMDRDIRDASALLGPYMPRLCSNLVADALLAMKMQEAHHKGIRFDCKAHVDQQTPLSDVELCAVFANMCDNALHACEALRAAGDNSATDLWIRVDARIDAHHCLVSVTNPYLRAPETRPHAECAHPDLREHGWGCSILESIAARHGGVFISAPRRGRWAARFSC
ncbi:GHKL domain-containing protein [Bifidobacterium pseudolongum]|nr:GHKL domain-containing protein [Bifidobacterium pseudolongum]